MQDQGNRRQTLQVAIEILAFLIIVLFAYAAVSKILDYERFKVQIGQSPILSGMQEIVPWLVVGLELSISLMLIFEATRLLAFMMSFGLMTMFTCYILIILSFSPFVPCSCGGVLTSLSWSEHLVLNVVFVFFSLGGIILQAGKHNWTVDLKVSAFWLYGVSAMRGALWIITGLVFIGSNCLVIAVALIVGVFQAGPSGFLRIYPPHPLIEKDTVDLIVDSYSVSGADGQYAYLGNSTAPLHMLRLGLKCGELEPLEIVADELLGKRYWSLKLKIDSPYFFLADGTIPMLYRGELSTGMAHEVRFPRTYFLDYEILSTSKLAIKYLGFPVKENMLATLRLESSRVEPRPEILNKQIDGVFCTDGSMCYDKASHQFIYTYYYRNEFIVMDSSLKLNYRGRTIDTTTTAKIKVVVVGTNERRLGAPPVLVNKQVAAADGLLFVQSNLRADNDAKDVLDNASIVDVYGLQDGRYKFSFHVFDYDGKKMSSFLVADNLFIAVLGDHLQSFEIQRDVFGLF